MLTPLDIQNVVFHRSFRGYDEKEVDDFLDRVVLEYEQLWRENNALKEEVARLREKVQELTRLQEVAERNLRLAEENAAEIKKNAEAQAAVILEQARTEGARMIQEVRGQIQQELHKLEELRRQESLFRTQLRTLLQTYLRILQAGPGEAEAAASAAPTSPEIIGQER